MKGNEMAYLPQDDDENQAQGLNQTLTQPAAPAAAASSTNVEPTQTGQQTAPAPASTTPAPAARNATQPNAKAGSGMFTNLKSYLTANQGNRIAGASAQKVANLAIGAQKGINQASTAFGQRVEQGTLANREQALQDVQNTIGAARGVAAKPQVPQSALNVAPNPQPSIAAQQAAAAAPAKEIPAAPIAEAAQAQKEEAATAEPTMQEPQYLTNEQQSRFADIINAKYAGPESIRQAGLLEPAQARVQEATRQGKNVQTAMGREELLRSMFGKNRDYTAGQNKLDALLLNTSQQGVGQLKQAGQGAQGLTQNLQKAENTSQNLANQRAQEIAGIQGQARSAFQTGRGEEENATEARMDALIKTPVTDENGKVVMKQDGTPMTEWDRLPEHFRQSLMNKGADATKVQNENRTALETQYAPQAARLTQANQQVADLTAQYKKAQQDAGFAFMQQDGTQETADRLNAIQARADALGGQLGQAKQNATNVTNSPEYQEYQQAKTANENMNKNQWMLSPEEAAILGVSSGEGLFNTQVGDIKTAEAKREKLITQDEFARQQALSQLAGLDRSKGLQKDLMYNDRSQAGTQDLLSSLDADAFRNQLNQAKEGFQQSAEGADITGTGKKKVSRGNALGKTTRTYTASTGGNVADLLKKGGYDFNTPEIDNSTNREALISALRDANRQDNGNDVERANAQNQLAASAQGATAGSAMGPWGALVGSVLGNITQSGTYDPGTHAQNLATGALGENNAFAKGHADIRNNLAAGGIGIGNALGGTAGGAIKNLASVVGGVDTGAMKKYGSAIAQQGALADFQKKYTDYLQGQGFENRANIANTDTTKARAEALKALLSRKG